MSQWNQPARLFVVTVLLIAGSLFLLYIRDLVKVMAAAGFVAYLLSPVVSYLTQRSKFSYRVSANIVYFVSLAVTVAVLSSLVPILWNQMEDISAAVLMVRNMVEPILARPLVLGPFQVSLALVIPTLEGILKNSEPGLVGALDLLENTSRNAAYFLLAVVGTYYLMVDWSRVREWLINLAPKESRHHMRHLYLEIRAVWMAYLRGQITLVFLVGVVFTVVLLFLGLPGALIVGPVTGLLSLVPEIGPTIGIIIAVLVALLEGSTYLPLSPVLFALLVLAVSLALLAVKNVWLRPRVMGRAVKMHEGLVFVAIISAVIYQGVLGALIVVPVMASVAVLGRYVRNRLLGLPPFPAVKTEDSVALLVDEVPEISRMHPQHKTAKKDPNNLEEKGKK